MVDFTRIIERTLYGGGDEEPEVRPRRRRTASRRLPTVKDGPLSQVFGEPEGPRDRPPPAGFSDRLGGIFGVDRESWEKRDGPK